MAPRIAPSLMALRATGTPGLAMGSGVCRGPSAPIPVTQIPRRGRPTRRSGPWPCGHTLPGVNSLRLSPARSSRGWPGASPRRGSFLADLGPQRAPLLVEGMGPLPAGGWSLGQLGGHSRRPGVPIGDTRTHGTGEVARSPAETQGLWTRTGASALAASAPTMSRGPWACG